MTNLELVICEAENAGEIDLDTRDILLGILNESTALSTNTDRRDEELKKIGEEISKLNDMKKKFKSEGNSRMVDTIDGKIEKLLLKLSRLTRNIRAGR